MRLKCEQCDYVVTRLYRLRAHGVSKHGIPDGTDEMNSYMKKCSKLNQRGIRYTSSAVLLKQLGRYGADEAFVEAGRALLAKYAVLVKESRNSENFQQNENVQVKPDVVGRPRQSRAHIANVGLVADFSKLCAIAKQYENVESAKTGRTAQSSKANANMIHRYIVWGQKSRPNWSEREIIFSPHLPKDFNNLLLSTFKPFTAKNHATALISLIDTILWNNQFREEIGFPANAKKALLSAKDSWEHIKMQNQRNARVTQRRKIKAGNFQNAPILRILQFLNEFAPKCEKDTFCLETNRGKATLLCVGAIYLALHGQRLCSCLNMTTEELNKAVCSKGRFVVRVASHKTAKFSGPAAIALKPHQYHLLTKIGEKCAVAGRPFGSAASGRACVQLFAPLNEYVHEKFPGAPCVTFNLIRKTISTNSFLVKKEGLAAAEGLVNTYLCHGKQVTDLHYSFLTDEKVISQARAVEEVIAALAALDLVRGEAVTTPGVRGKSFFVPPLIHVH